MNLYIIDGIGPFFKHYQHKKINWSKIPFEHLHTEGEARDRQFAEIRADLNQFAQRVKAVGYNAITLDDVAHLTDHPLYEPSVRTRIRSWQHSFKPLLADLKALGLKVFITMDVFSATPASRTALAGSKEKIDAYLAEVLQQFLSDFPEADGVVLRVGECDGKDVNQDFKSQLYLKSAKDLNRLLLRLLPIFEQQHKKLILRTWTVGAYRLGDLIWHRGTLARTLKGIDSPELIVSMKHGESDFFRYLPLNKSFFRHSVAKIVELQSKREYEGCGEFPAFVGHEYEQFARELRHARNLVGISVWCQTGGWVPFRRLAYLGEGSRWTELNSEVTLRLFRHNESVEQALATIVGEGKANQMGEFLRLSEEAIRELYYHEEFARQKLFFRRVRIPPLIGVYWNTIFVNHSLKRLLGHFVTDPDSALRAADSAMQKISRMERLAGELGLPLDDIEFMRDTFAILALAREYYYRPFSADISKRLEQAKKQYKKKYPKGLRYRYSIKLDFKPFRLHGRFLAWSLAVLLRQQRGYRLIDQLFTLHLLSFLFHLITRSNSRWIPKFARKSAMGVETVFK